MSWEQNIQKQEMCIRDRPCECAEETMKEIILETHANAAQELGRGILERVLTYSEYKAEDDMTILTAGLWRN